VNRSDELAAKLTADSERPWAEWGSSKPLTQRQLATLLRPFQIFSTTVHPADRPDGKGYKRADFEEVWDAYLHGQKQD
jgi:hypothetical protein